MDFKLDIQDLKQKSLTEVKAIIESNYKCPLNELKFFDLLIYKKYDQTSGEKKDEGLRHGIYMFFNESQKCVYVGMCSSSHFAHRLGGHFGMSPKYKMNTFLRRAVEEMNHEATYQGYIDTAKNIGDYSYLVIGANGEGKAFIMALEKLFHVLYLPSFNRLSKRTCEKHKSYDMNHFLEDVLPKKIK